MAIKKVVVCGGGVLGSQIAFQAQYCGFDTTIWLRSEGSIGRTQPKLDKIHATYLEALKEMKDTQSEEAFCPGLADSYEDFDYDECVKKTEYAYSTLKLELDMEKALADADLVIEAMTEEKNAKKAIFQRLAPLLPEKTILVTNSSSLLPSKFMKYTGRPDKFLALHFANDIYKHNTAEVMMTSKTDEAAFDAVVQFALDIKMVPLKLTKEKDGYLLNSMLIPFLMSGFDLYANGISVPEDIDKAWKLGTGAPKGPFEIFDIVGLKPAYEIINRYTKLPGFIAPYNFKAQAAILKPMIEAGHIGKMAGEGFYKYDKDGNKIEK